MRFVHCVGISVLMHLALLFLIVVPGQAILTGEQAAEPIEVSVLDEPPMVQAPPPEERPTEPIFKADAVAEGVREGMGALVAAPRLRDPRVPPAISPDPPPDDPRAETGVAEVAVERTPSSPDPEESEHIAPTATGTDDRASEATGTEEDATRETRVTPDAPPSTAPTPTPARPPGDMGSGSGPGGTSEEGTGPAPRPGGPPAAPIGPGTGVDAPGQGVRGPGEGAHGAGHSAEGTGRDGGATAPTPPAPKPATAHITGPPCPPTREMARLNIHGTIRVSVTVSYPSGAITSATVVSSSGYPEYDAKAAQWVRSNWRATWSGGAPPTQRTFTVSLSF